jgi:hypothetical protein
MIFMARGWESKGIEEQQAEAAANRNAANRLVATQLSASEKQRQGLALSRKRILQQLAAATHPAHRRMLERALADLDQKLSRLE